MKCIRNDKDKLVIVGTAFCLVIFWSSIPFSYAQSIPITISGQMDKVVFDGKWTFQTEWKASSVDTINTESGRIYIRTAHQENYIYVMIDAVADTTVNKNKDSAMICFDTENNQSSSPDDNDYCFFVKLADKEPITLRGSNTDGQLKIVQNHDGLIAIGGSSDVNDRYSKVPHASYEFRIPLDLLQRSDRYGFFLAIFDFDKSETFTWPSGLKIDSEFKVPSPQEWGSIYSPDKSLPEYDLPVLVLFIATSSIIFVSSRFRKIMINLSK